jgi:D-glycero-D-manno-heptose 1,7-bisphosphate phosphatase
VINSSDLKKAVFLDRDGTINVEKNYLYKIEDFEFIDGVLKALRELSDAGFLLIIITNQSGIARGYYTEKDYGILNSWLFETFAKNGIKISASYFCPHLPDASVERYRTICNCRKPNTGLFEQAVKDFNIDLKKSFAIGDKIRDLAICEKSECKGFLIGDNEETEIIEKIRNGGVPNVVWKKNILDCVFEILR